VPGLEPAWPLAAAAVGPGDDLQQVAVGVFEVHAAAAVAVVDRPALGLAGIGPVGQLLVADAAERRPGRRTALRDWTGAASLGLPRAVFEAMLAPCLSDEVAARAACGSQMFAVAQALPGGVPREPSRRTQPQSSRLLCPDELVLSAADTGSIARECMTSGWRLRRALNGRSRPCYPRNRAGHRPRSRCGLARCLVRELVAVPPACLFFVPGKTRRIS